MVVNMSISNASANAIITCRAYLVNGTVLSRAAYLTVQTYPMKHTLVAACWCSTSIPDHHSIGEKGWGLDIRGWSPDQ